MRVNGVLKIGLYGGGGEEGNVVVYIGIDYGVCVDVGLRILGNKQAILRSLSEVQDDV
jgi:hypothetical protein